MFPWSFCLLVYLGFFFLVGWGLGVFCLFFCGIVSFRWGLVLVDFGFRVFCFLGGDCFCMFGIFC